MKNIMVKLANVNPYELFANLLIILLSGHGLLRAYDWITMLVDTLEKVSPLYYRLSAYLDIHALGWLFALFSITLLLSVFFKGRTGWLFLLLGSLGAGVIHLIFGVIATQGAVLFVTYYLNLLCGVIQFILAIIGGAQLWKHSHLKK
ncbi:MULTISPECIES: hypothetical protein [Mammaliicoccus]|uniref:Uncharacterized protein n=1 Tax=Mammaliicoccus lentus TaxID=42858 RepID=A0ABS6GTB1_MAMLE|nr:MULTISPECIES: hypothetical protein [Mammaliicoccus]MBU6112559.1 hypothetical protein [Mammaliicoccus lentus]